MHQMWDLQTVGDHSWDPETAPPGISGETWSSDAHPMPMHYIPTVW